MSYLQKILTQIRQAEAEFQRESNSVKLLAVTKGREIPAIQALARAGQAAFGENYLQEALIKIQALSALGLEWHFIGNLQANKTRAVAENFSWVQSVSRLKIAERLSMQRPAELPPLNICLEVNISAEFSKSGAAVEELIELAHQVVLLPRLRLRGLMVIPERLVNFPEQLQIYQKVYRLYQQLLECGFSLDTLSMGMSADFCAAIAAGSTLVRIGSALFN